MKIAICLSGQARNWDGFQESYWYDSSDEVYTFIHSWNNTDYPIGLGFITKFNPTAIKTEDWNDNEDKFRLMYQQFDCKEGRHYKSALPMFYSMQESSLLMEKYKKEHNLEFDLIIRSRFDLRLANKIEYNLEKGIHIPSDRRYYGVCDQLAYGDYDSMVYYSRCYDFLLSAIYENRSHCFYLDPEYALMQHLNRKPAIKQYKYDMEFLIDRGNNVQN